MINRFKYMLKIKTTHSIFLIRTLFENESIKKMTSKERRKTYIKKCFRHPIVVLKKLMKKEFNIRYMELVLTTKCTLNCNGCSALMNYYNKRCDINIDKNIESLKKVVSVCDSINQLRLLGGEPLLYNNLYELLTYINKQDKIKRATIVTNGTLIINDDRIINILKGNRFDVFISDYGKNSTKKEELIKQLVDNNIKFEIGREESLWRDYGDLTNRGRKEKALKDQFANCKIMCTSILDGKIHHCPRSSHGTNIKRIPLRNQDYIDLLDNNLDEKELKKELYAFLFKYVPYVEACNYCNSGTKELNTILAGQQCNNKSVEKD